jgi:nitric oxide reductase NorQ protein
MTSPAKMTSANTPQPEARQIDQEPYYEPVADEVALFEAAAQSQIPVLLKGPTGSGKTRFIEYVAWKLRRPLITVSCHDDLTASDLVGRYLITNKETVWIDGPLAHAVRVGGICYLDEVVEARKDTTVVIHPLADDRRMLPIEKHGELLRAPKSFVLAMSYNPGYQSVLKELKQSTRQRFVAIEFNYPAEALEAKIVATESGLDTTRTASLLKLAHMTRNLKGNGLDEGASTRLLVHAAKLMQRGIAPRVACHGAIAEALTDDAEILRAIDELIASIF